MAQPSLVYVVQGRPAKSFNLIIAHAPYKAELCCGEGYIVLACQCLLVREPTTLSKSSPSALYRWHTPVPGPELTPIISDIRRNDQGEYFSAEFGNTT